MMFQALAGTLRFGVEIQCLEKLGIKQGDQIVKRRIR